MRESYRTLYKFALFDVTRRLFRRSKKLSENFFYVTNEMSIAAFESVKGQSQEIGENSVKLFSFNLTANAGLCMRVGLQLNLYYALPATVRLFCLYCTRTVLHILFSDSLNKQKRIIKIIK